MKKILALLLVLVLAFSLVACAETPPADTSEPAADPGTTDTQEPVVDDPAPATEAPGTDIKVGVILVHDENSGYDMAHIEGVWAARDALGLTDANFIFKYNVPEDEKCYDNAVDLAEQGCDIIISDS